MKMFSNYFCWIQLINAEYLRIYIRFLLSFYKTSDKLIKLFGTSRTI